MDLDTFEGRSISLIATFDSKLQAAILLERCIQQKAVECMATVDHSCVLCLAILCRHGAALTKWTPETAEQLQLALDGLTFQLRAAIRAEAKDTDAVLAELRSRTLRAEPELLDRVWNHRPFNNPDLQILIPHKPHLAVRDAFFSASRRSALTPGMLRCLCGSAHGDHHSAPAVHPRGMEINLPSHDVLLQRFMRCFDLELSKRDLEHSLTLPQFVYVYSYKINLTDPMSICAAIVRSDPYVDLSAADATCEDASYWRLKLTETELSYIAEEEPSLFFAN